ncbi:MAG: hypothetical protein HY670_04350 [Chloroflexi bacterium]|nr:hypothetical protein [Chloroflexota bacterium]
MGIKGFFPTGFHMLPAPSVQAALFLPRLNLQGLTSFMIDTGADNTTLSLSDVERINLSYRQIKRSSAVGVEGIAGEQLFYQEAALLIFRAEDAKQYVFSIMVHIPRRGTSGQAEQQRRLPSILGRDVINQCRLVVSFHEGIVELVPPEGAMLPVAMRRLL